MAKITAITNGLQGLTARQRINEAIKSVEVDSTITGDGNVGTALSIQTSLDTKLNQPNNIVVVNSISDFPAAVGGVITLEDDTNYLIAASISTSNRFVCGQNNCIFSYHYFTALLTYTGTGVMFTGANKNFSLFRVGLNAPNASEVFNMTDLVFGQTYTFEMDSVAIESCQKVGTFNNLRSALFVNSNANCVDGITLAGIFVIISARQFALIADDTSFIGIDFGTSTVFVVELTDCYMSNASASYGLSGLANNGNLPPGSIASVTNCEFLGGITPLQNISIDDYRWEFRSNSGLQDTMPDAMVSLNSNSTETTIGTAEVPVKVEGTFVVERQSHFTANTTGRITYDGERNLTAPVDITISVEPVSGTNKAISVYLAKNGSVIANSRKTIVTNAGDASNLTVFWQLVLQENDYLEIFIANDTTSSNNIIARSAILRVR